MSEKTAISWCDATFNPWWGCSKVSPACDHCYAERDAKRFAAGRVLWGIGADRRTFGEKHWSAPRDWAKSMPKKLGRRPRVFCASMGDWLDLDAPLDEFVRLLDAIRCTPELDWLLLSKRIGNWRKRLEAAAEATIGTGAIFDWTAQWLGGNAPANVWLGATVVNQEEADRDVPKLLAVPARVRFLSIEPMLSPVDLSTHRGAKALPLYWEGTDADGLIPVHCGLTGRHLGDFARRGWVKTSENMSPCWVDWVICGGESGPHARPMHPAWVRSLRDQCAAAGVPFHLKQWGEWAPYDRGCTDGKALATAGSLDEPMQRFGKKAAGRQLDGRTHDEFPD